MRNKLIEPSYSKEGLDCVAQLPFVYRLLKAYSSA